MLCMPLSPCFVLFCLVLAPAFPLIYCECLLTFVRFLNLCTLVFMKDINTGSGSSAWLGRGEKCPKYAVDGYCCGNEKQRKQRKQRKQSYGVRRPRPAWSHSTIRRVSMPKLRNVGLKKERKETNACAACMQFAILIKSWTMQIW
jgi:hypothetical protein